MSDDVKEPTATNLFSAYMRSMDKVRALTKSLAEETIKAENLARQLAAQYGIYVTGSKPTPQRAQQPMTAPHDDSAGTSSGEETPEFKPPAQYRSDAPELASAGSEEVAEIRRDAGLDVDAADSEALANAGAGMMEHLQSGMKGAPSVVAMPGIAQESAPDERSNAEGGPVTQKPVEE